MRPIVVALLIALAATLLPGHASWAQSIVRDVQVTGNQRIEADTVRSYMGFGVGDSYDPLRTDKALKALFATGLFADVSIRRDGDTVVVSVVENPIINRLAFEGNKRINDDVLEPEVQLRPRVVYTRSRVQADVRRLIQVYRRSGRFAATVEPKVIQLPQNRVDLVFEINEGDLTGVERIDFIGNRRYDDGDLRGAVATKESAWYRFFTSDDTYDPDRLTLDRELLRKYYLKRGYADFRVVSAVAELSRDRSEFFITFTVEEGELYTFGKIELTTTLRDLDPERMREQLSTFEGETYDAEAIEKSIEAITFELGRLGYAFVDVRPRVNRDRENRTIGINYEIAEGPRVYVEQINITGNVRTLDKVIRREFRLSEGDAFNTAKLRRSRQRIQGLGFFDKVEITQAEGSQPDRIVINTDVQEKSTGELSFGAGVSTAEALIGDISIRERNLLGRGQDLRVSLTLSSRRRQVDLSFTEPYFLDRNVAAGFDLFNVQRDLQTRSSYDEENRGGRLRTNYAITERLRMGLDYTLRQDELTNLDTDISPFLRREEGASVTSSVGYDLTFDTRDQPFDPNEGMVLRFSQDFAGLGGDIRFVRSTIAWSYYYPFVEDVVGSFGFSGGHIIGLDQDVRVIDRFFLGGDSFRGFESGGVGPRDRNTDDSIGGNVFYVATTELRFPLGFASEFGINGRVFAEVGTLVDPDVSGPALLDSNAPRVSGGFGISWVSPFGPIRVDLAAPFVKEDFDQEEFFRFSFGTRF